ncbi:tRNA (adenine(58)-N(1))-methyltransferase catalytic subunit trmt61a [Phytophthora boehmeriae]|uniref:tRNA (Adenine(58)-N(1))-methyltransferase catalytic subunit trmt61a n=1 Tax=Phytophthora boehmeriae TaxID=109152 RepID=A0A8T1W4A3_9STRA|nr:tRNA (adenine(58)-N(1))-methyltransferase catalytic subunit trmt61a [Phytophthora boehmeriae]
MNRVLFVAIAAVVFTGGVIAIDHDKVQPIAEPTPVTVSEKTAVKFKPMLTIESGCDSFPAINAAGEVTGGLKGTGGTSGCKVSLLGSQVYGRAAWHNDIWAIMYA